MTISFLHVLFANYRNNSTYRINSIYNRNNSKIQQLMITVDHFNLLHDHSQKSSIINYTGLCPNCSFAGLYETAKATVPNNLMTSEVIEGPHHFHMSNPSDTAMSISKFIGS